MGIERALDCAVKCQQAGGADCDMWMHDSKLKQCFLWKPSDKLSNGCDVTGNYNQMTMGKLPSYTPTNADNTADKITWGKCQLT
jgi:hypothetical protein